MKKTIILGLITSTILIIAGKTSAQQLPVDSIVIKQISSDLSISIDKAIALKAALQVNLMEIESLSNDNTVKPKQRMARIDTLLAARDRGIKTLLTPDEFQRFRDFFKKKMSAKRKEAGDELAELKKTERSRQHTNTPPVKH